MADTQSNDSPIDLSALVGAAGKLNTDLNASLTRLNTAEQALSVHTATMNNSVNEAAAAQQALNTTVAARAQKVQQQTLDLASAMGTNPAANSYILADMAKRMNADYQRAYDTNETIRQKSEVGFFDDPLAWISNQITIPFDKDALRSNLDAFNISSTNMKEMMSRTSEAAALNAAIAASDIDAELTAKNKKIAADAAKEVAMNELRLAQVGIETINIRRAMSKDQFDLTVALSNARAQAHNIALQERQYNLSVQKFEQDKRQFDLTKERFEFDKTQAASLQEIRDLQIKAAKEEEEAKAALNVKLTKLAIITGTQPLTYEQFKMLSPATRSAYEQLMSNPALEQQKLGFSTVDGLDTANQFNFPLTPSMNYIREQLTTLQAGMGQKFPGVWNTLKPAEQRNYTEMEIRKTVTNELTNIPNEKGLYSPPPLAAIITNPNLANLKLTKDLQPLITANVDYATKADDIINAAVLRITNNGATPAEMAKEIATIYNTVIVENNTTRNYARWQMPELQALQTGYNQTVHATGGFRAKQVINLVNEAQIESLLTRKIIFNRFGNFSPVSTVPGLDVTSNQSP